MLRFVLLATALTTPLAAQEWPSAHQNLEAQRYSPLDRIDRANIGGLREICRYDLGRQTSMQSGPVVTGGTLYLTTDLDTIALDPATCAVKWKVTEQYKPANMLNVNRGAAVLDGRVFRGTQDGRVLAYEASNGKRLWEATIGDAAKGESVPAALIAWEGLVFAGNAGGDNKGVKGRMYALDAATGRIVWEQYLVPRSAGDPTRGPSAPAPDFPKGWDNAADVPVSGGATWTSYSLDSATGTLYVPGGNPAPDFVAHMRPGGNPFTGSVLALDARTGAVRAVYPLVPEDFHDWDVSAAPAIVTTRGGRKLVAAAIKDGRLYGIDAATGRTLYQTPVTTILNATAPLTAKAGPVRFCPGTQGGVEWNGPAYSARTNLLYTGAVDWCSTVTVSPDSTLKAVAVGQPWTGDTEADHGFGKFDPQSRWKGWVQATDADTGQVSWRFRTPAPVLGGVTATGGGLVFAGDMEGNLFALDASNGQVRWRASTGGAIGGGIITYAIGGEQRVAVATGMTSPIWPTAKVNAQLRIYGLASGS